MPYRSLLVLALVGLVGCNIPVPEFLGREGTGGSSYTLRPPPLPDPVPIPMRSARAERGLRGFIVRVEAVAPTQGFFSAALVPTGGGVPDEAGVMTYMLVARPPTGPQAIGPERTRELHAGLFVPTVALRSVNAVRITAPNTTQTLSLR